MVTTVPRRPGERIVAIEWGPPDEAGLGTTVFFVIDGTQDRKVMDLPTVKGLVQLIFDGRYR